MTDRPSAEERRAAFGAALGDAMRARGVTQRDLSAQVGITQSAISDWVNGMSAPDVDVVFDIEIFLKLPPGHLSKHLGYFPPAALKKAPKPDFEAVVLDDPLLSDDAKTGLLGSYRAYMASRRRRRNS